jgi:histidine triad (HIT) family protein
MDCIFCRIVHGEIAAQVVREDTDTIAFRDLNPQAPVHVLVVPRRHIASVNDATEAERDVLGGLIVAARAVAQAEQLAESGYRLVLNTGPDAGQTVPHVHLHVLGGRAMRWPPG